MPICFKHRKRGNKFVVTTDSKEPKAPADNLLTDMPRK